MFTIIGGDGKEYGPASVEQIRAWITAGRANLQTQAKAVGSEEWRMLGDYPEFSPAAGAPPPLPAQDGAGLVQAEREVRLFARMIDWCLRIIFSLPGTILLGSAAAQALVNFMQTETFDPQVFQNPRVILGAVVWLIGIGILFVVQVSLLTIRGQTIGKIAMGIRIVRMADGAKPGFFRAWVLRELLPSLLGFVPIIGPFVLSPIFFLVDCCFIFRADRRCVHDFIAGTRVVKA